ncbi:MAG: response regulator [Candidatus Omnitrophota bacterium]|jgi:sigma-B regulation protein RsbU (phosphoserine phosphatase)|nr:MAG: response regulator [Candidatus Omnitrophota bacterium]
MNSRFNHTKSLLTEHPVTVLLIDDQVMVGEAVRRMLAAEEDIRFHFCDNPTEAVSVAERINPTVILQDLVMPEIDGLTLVQLFREKKSTRDIPLIVLSIKEDPKVKAEAFALGVNDYLVKLPDKLELIARIRYHSHAYINLLQRNEAYEALIKSKKRLAAELAEAAEYVRSLFPKPLSGDIRTDWCFIPSTQLGGDSFGYHWLDSDSFAIYLVDVCGHGVGAAMLSISIVNTLRSESLPAVDFRNPSEVLDALNHTFPMEKQNGMFFTIWYGVFHKKSRRLVYASGGHPPALLIQAGKNKVEKLTSKGIIVGVNSGFHYQSADCMVEKSSRLYVFSDGVYEIRKGDGKFIEFDQFVSFVVQPPQLEKSTIAGIKDQLSLLHENDDFDDDYSMLEIIFS